MFYSLHQTVTANADNIIILNSVVPIKYKSAAINDASGTIVDVLKSQLETGKLKELIKFFQTSGLESSFLVSIIIKKYTNRLNKYYSINFDDARNIADKLIPNVMNNFLSVTKQQPCKDDTMFSFFNWLSGNTINFEALFAKMTTTQLA